jgi:hypothetical protein
MKLIFISVYGMVYRVTKTKQISAILTILYVTALNLLIVQGLSLLLQGIAPTGLLLKLFSFPYYMATAVAMLALVLSVKPPSRYLDVEHNRKSGYMTTAIYSLIAILLLLYILVCNGQLKALWMHTQV